MKNANFLYFQAEILKVYAQVFVQNMKFRSLS